MDVFDERILSVLKDGKPRLFIELLDRAGFSHNTLKLHLKRLLGEGVLVRQKIASEGLGRPRVRLRHLAQCQETGFHCLVGPSN